MSSMSDDQQAESERSYQSYYYEIHREARSKKNQWLWENDPDYRRQEIERSQKRRAQKRSEKAHARFAKMVESKRAEKFVTEAPRPIIECGRVVEVYSTGSLGREVGRSPRVIREWLNEDILPGSSVLIDGAAFFTKAYSNAVYRACKRLYCLDGRGSKRVLKRLIREELVRGKIKFILLGGVGGSEQDKTSAVTAI